MKQVILTPEGTAKVLPMMSDNPTAKVGNTRRLDCVHRYVDNCGLVKYDSKAYELKQYSVNSRVRLWIDRATNRLYKVSDSDGIIVPFRRVGQQDWR